MRNVIVYEHDVVNLTMPGPSLLGSFFRAYVEGEPHIRGDGKTKGEAVINLLQTHGDKFDIKLTLK